MVVEKIGNEKLVMTFENTINAFDIQSLIDYARHLEAKSNAMQLSIVQEEDDFDDDEITPLVKSLCGVLKLPSDFDYKTEYGDYILQKYG